MADEVETKEVKKARQWKLEELPEQVKNLYDQLAANNCAPKNPRPVIVQRDFLLLALGIKADIKDPKPGKVARAIHTILGTEANEKGLFPPLTIKKVTELDADARKNIKKNLKATYESLPKGGGIGRGATIVDVAKILENF